MTNRERFRAVFHYEPVDRIPLYFFGTWMETKERWAKEGLQGDIDFEAYAGPQVPGMDLDWELPMWDCHDLVNIGLIGDQAPEILEETHEYLVQKNSVGEIAKTSKKGSTIAHTIKYALEPTRESWENFKRYIDPNDPRRYPDGWQERARLIQQEDRVLSFLGGSLYGLLRNWMGVEAISMLMYDDPELHQEMTEYMADFYMLLVKPVLEIVSFEFAYFFEDCCGSDGPLFSPDIFSEVYAPQYERIVSFYKQNGVAFTLVDSDGKADMFIPLWAKCGIDIMFPVEVGKWNGNVADLRAKFGADLRFMGGVDKYVIMEGEDAIRKHLLTLKPEVDKGGYLPIPDHRIPPDCSLQMFEVYVRVFHEIFG